jgi:hypothetical protein
MTEHREVPVKVNAWVDEGIADLVAALSEVDGLVTLESCQGNPGTNDAFVYFRLGNWRQSGEFLFEKLLTVLPPDLLAVTSLRLSAYDTDIPLASITIEPCAVPALTQCVRDVSASIRPRALMARDAHGLAIAEGITAPGGH